MQPTTNCSIFTNFDDFGRFMNDLFGRNKLLKHSLSSGKVGLFNITTVRIR